MFKCSLALPHETRPCVLVGVDEDCAIFGLNLIHTFRVSYDATNQRLSYPLHPMQSDSELTPRAPPPRPAPPAALHTHNPALALSAIASHDDDVQITIAKHVEIPAHATRWVKLHMASLPNASSKVRQGQDVLATVQGITHHLVPDAHNNCIVPLTNAEALPRRYRRADLVGSGEVITDLAAQSYPVSALPQILRDDAQISSLDIEPISAADPPPSVTQAMIIENTQYLTEDVRDLIRALLWEERDVFSSHKLDLGRTDTWTHKIHLTDRKPVWRSNFRLNEAHIDLVRAQARLWLKLGLVEPSSSPFNAPVFCVKKKDGSFRVVLDYRGLNANTRKENYCIRTVEECIAEVGRNRSTLFSTLDLTSGFWQMNLHPEHRPYTAFSLPGLGALQWRVSPMGLTGCPASFARLMDIVMKPVAAAITYIDDVLINSRTLKDHVRDLKLAFAQIRKHNLKLNLQKCFFATRSCQYLGHTLTDKGILPGADKTAALAERDPPTTVKGVREFIGLCNFFRAFVPNFSVVSGHLTRLTGLNVRLVNGKLPPEALDSFHALRNAIVSKPILAYPTREGEFHLMTDAAQGLRGAPGGLGACLLQRQDGRLKVIAYASRGLAKAEANYPAFLLEMKALTWAVEHFRHFLAARHFYAYTDHKPLQKLQQKHSKTLSQLQHLMLQHSFTLRYTPAKNNAIADYLSRHTVSAAKFVPTQERLLHAQTADPVCKALATMLEAPAAQIKDTADRAAAECRLTAGQLLRVTKLCVLRNKLVCYRPDPNGPSRVVVPAQLRPELLRLAHEHGLAGHGGRDQTAARLRPLFWWPHMHNDVRKFVTSCTTCQSFRHTHKQTHNPLTPLDAPSNINERIHVDLFGPLSHPDSPTGHKFVCIITDAFSKLAEAHAINDKEAGTVANCIFQQWFCRFGIPRRIISDGGAEFCNSLSASLWQLLNVHHNKTTPYHPQTNGQAETFNKTVRRYLQTLMATTDIDDWTLLLPPLNFAYNTAVHKSTKQSPFFTTYGVAPRMPQWGDIPDILDDSVQTPDGLSDILKRITQARETASANNATARETYTKQYNQGKLLHKFKPNDWVLVRAPAPAKTKLRKLSPPWKGPFLVLETHDNGTITIRYTKKTTHVRKTINADNAKLYTPANPSQDVSTSNPTPPRPKTPPRRSTRIANKQSAPSLAPVCTLLLPRKQPSPAVVFYNPLIAQA